MSKWNRMVEATTTDGLGLIRDVDYAYQAPLVRNSYDPFRGSSREYVWTDDAACAKVNPELFQISQVGDPGLEGLGTNEVKRFNQIKVADAKKYCESCPVKKRCLEEATESDLYWSVRGGETPKRLDPNVRHIPLADTNSYFPWECKKCGSGDFGWHMNKGAMRKYCKQCAAGWW